MIRRTAAFLLLWTAFLLPSAAQQTRQQSSENQFSVDETLFTVMTAINMAGYDAGLSSPLNQRYQVRQQVRDELSKRNIPCLPELKKFYLAHRREDETADLSQYVSFALLASKPPMYELPEGALPADVEALRGFAPLMTRFYQEANLAELWKRAFVAYVNAIRDYQDPVTNTIFEANGYVRNPSGYLGRRFQVFLDLMAAPNQVQVRSYADDYYVVITPAATPAVDEIRDAYLAWLLDPLTFKYSTTLKDKKPLAKYVQDAPVLAQVYKDDFSLLLIKSLIKAIDARLMHGGDEARGRFVQQAMSQGYILTAAFYDLLPVYEKQEQPLASYFPDLVNAINVRKEEKRISKVEFATSRPGPVATQVAKPDIPPAEATLASAEGLYEQEHWDAAAKLYKQVFEQTTDKAIQGQAYYGLARVAVHQMKPQEAVELFQRTVDANPNPVVTAWAHVYLARLANAHNDPEEAEKHFKAALAIDGATPLARDAAENGLKALSEKKNK